LRKSRQADAEAERFAPQSLGETNTEAARDQLPTTATATAIARYTSDPFDVAFVANKTAVALL
jgi:hypothetical protein